MSEGERGEANMDKSTGRQSSVPPRPNGADSKKDGNGNQGKRRGGRWKESRPKHEGTQQRRPPAQQPQKFRPTDKRPRTRGYYNDGQKQEMTEHDDADYGSVMRPGSKKQNYNHLLNFSYGNREREMGGGRGYSRDGGMPRRKWSGVRYNKEQFLQANCQFVVAEGEDFSVHSADPDTLVEWSLIEQVRLFGEGVPSCPICLYAPVAAKMTRCGHIYCWPCILHYLSLSEKSWAKCPICFDAVHEKDLKSVVALAAPPVAAKDVLTMTLMKRVRDSTYAAPVTQWSSSYRQPYNMQQADKDTCFAKLLTARPDQIHTNILGPERNQLVTQLGQEDKGSLEGSYIQAALEALNKRDKDVAGKQQTKESITKLLDTLTLDDKTEKPAADAKPQQPLIPRAPAKSYVSAFSDEEEESPEDAKQDPKGQEDVIAQEGVVTQEAEISQESAVSQESSSAEENAAGQDNTDGSAETDSGPQSPKFTIGEEESETTSKDEEAELVEEAAASLSLPPPIQENKPQARQPNKVTDVYYFYQASSGQQIYMHSLNARCLAREYGSLEHCPPNITATVSHVDPCTMTGDLRSRLKYINHLPLTCEFQVAELDLTTPLISKATRDEFKDEIDRRRKDKRRKEQAENRKLKRMQQEENRKAEQCPQLRASLGGIQSHSFPEICSVIVPSEAPNMHRVNSASSSPSSTPIGSPSQQLSTDQMTVAEQDGQGSFSYSQMLRAGKAKAQEGVSAGSRSTAPAWPTAAASNSRKTPGSDDSDNEDRVPVPQYHASFQFDIEAALHKAKSSSAEAGAAVETGAGSGSGGGKKKKKKVKQLLFSTSMNRQQ